MGLIIVPNDSPDINEGTHDCRRPTELLLACQPDNSIRFVSVIIERYDLKQLELQELFPKNSNGPTADPPGSSCDNSEPCS